MARISHEEQAAVVFKAVREVPRDGLLEWREAVRRHLRLSQGMTLVDIGARTGAFAAAFSDWFDLSVLAVEPYEMPRTQRTRKPEATGLTSWFCADRFAREASLDVLPSEARPGRVRPGERWRDRSWTT